MKAVIVMRKNKKDNVDVQEEVVTSLNYKKRRRRLGDRSDGRKLRTLQPMNRLMPYIMKNRSDAQNTFADKIEVSKADLLCRQKVLEGKTNFSFLHVLLAAYLRTITQRPAINRFVSGQKIYARNEIVFVMTIKKEMSLSAPDTVIKVKFSPDDTLDEVYEKFNIVATDAIASLEKETAFDKLIKIFNLIPGFVLRFIVWLVKCLDYIGILPKAFMDLLPFYGSMIVTSMGSLGINPIYHHIYDFGNLPVFLSYGRKRTVFEYDKNGNLNKKRYIDIKAVTDERICDGFYFASAFKYFKKIIENPECLETKATELFEDID
jgi:hypothetical protein